MKTKNILLGSILIVAFCILYTGCKKDKKEKPSNYSAATDNAVADNAFAGIWKQVSTVTDSSGNLQATSGCPTVSTSGSSFPKTIVIDFGTSNCLGKDGNYRRGKITAVFSGKYLDSNTVITTTLTNYFHNDYQIEGTQTIKNKGRIIKGHWVYNVVVNNGSVTSPDRSKISTWITNQNREFYAGYKTSLYIFDDIYKISGTASGVAADGDAYSIVTNQDLQINVGCHWIVAGKLTLTLSKYPTYPIVVDYGAGACDPDATVLLDGKTYNIKMQ
ncbi:MAG: hypothetical protein H0W84_06925 [Bacteroidetes bacterium]|nr:hypothetical protein [Bacteroidota bacterium]